MSIMYIHSFILKTNIYWELFTVQNVQFASKDSRNVKTEMVIQK